ncbi:uncharacterized protein [Aegilops tauschii subsp. strangulata]|uniref:uncharacterized protein n=1 Tax=Aegilops tauschii subsp. strangulata TaxID=200361 RepID=UPI003CC8C789
MVSELIDATSATWNFQRLHEVFMPMDIPAIMGIPLCTRNVEDYWGWHFERSGVFTVKSAYKMLVATKLRMDAWLEESAGSSSINTEEKPWKMLWKTQVSGKIRMFLWRLSKHSVPTEDVRAHRHMTNLDACGLCGGTDSWRHSLLECTVARCTWALVDDDIAQHLIATTEPDARHWLVALMDALPHMQFIKVAVTLWAIWSSRRKAIHEGIFQSPQATHMFIDRYIRDLEILREPRSSPSTGVAAESRGNRRQKAPPTRYAKIHVDARVSAREGVTAAVCRDDQAMEAARERAREAKEAAMEAAIGDDHTWYEFLPILS